MQFIPFVDSSINMPSTKSERGGGGHIDFSADPGRRRWRRCDSLYPPYFLNLLVEFYQTSMDTSLG